MKNSTRHLFSCVFILLFVSSHSLLKAGGFSQDTGKGLSGGGGSKLSNTSTSSPPSTQGKLPTGPVSWPSTVFPLDQIEDAQEEAWRAGKGIVIISTRLNEGNASDYVALELEKFFKNYAAVVYAHCHNEDSKLPPGVLDAIHDRAVGGAPKTVVLDPDLKKVLDVISYEFDDAKRNKRCEEAVNALKNYYRNDAPFTSKTETPGVVICRKHVPAFSPTDPKKSLGNFFPNTILSVGALQPETDLINVTFTDPKGGKEIKALCPAKYFNN